MNINMVMDIVMGKVVNIDQERQTLPGLAAFQAELRPLRTLVPAGRRDSQLPPGNRRESGRKIEIFDPRQLWFREPSGVKISYHRQPHFLPGYWSWRRGRRRAGLLRRKPGCEEQAGYDFEGEKEAGENHSGNHFGPSAFSGCSPATCPGC